MSVHRVASSQWEMLLDKAGMNISTGSRMPMVPWDSQYSHTVTTHKLSH